MVMNETQQNMTQKFAISQERFIVRENNRISYIKKVGYYININMMEMERYGKFGFIIERLYCGIQL